MSPSQIVRRPFSFLLEQIAQNATTGNINFSDTTLLGRGSFAVCTSAWYANEHITAHDFVAVKIAVAKKRVLLNQKNGIDEHVVNEMLKKEGLILEDLALADPDSTANIVRFIEAGSTALGINFLVLKLANLGTVNDYILSNGAYPIAPLSILGNVLSGLDFVHRHSVSHLDIKPDNFLIHQRADGEILALISDFGGATRAKYADIDSMMVGCPFYRGPEFFYDSKKRYQNLHAHDVFAVGVSFWKMVYRELPYGIGAAAPAREVVEWTRNEMYRQSELHVEFFERVMTYDPAKRATTSELLDFLAIL